MQRSCADKCVPKLLRRAVTLGTRGPADLLLAREKDAMVMVKAP